ncbi:MAG: adenylate/guanylate cyclase domain-containing protein [Microthrixaceae bacterium]
MSNRTQRPSAHVRPAVAAPFDGVQRAMRRLTRADASNLGPDGSPIDGSRGSTEAAGEAAGDEALVALRGATGHPVNGAGRPTDETTAGSVVASSTSQIPAIAPQGTGIERPVPEWVELNQAIYRAFAFVDLCGFTNYTDKNGAHAATELLARFRSATRDVTTRRGTRVAKWLGDGVMLVGTSAGPIVATVAELQLRFLNDEFDIHAGVAAGPVLLFEGDDYIGRAVNLAARLCEAAAPGEILAYGIGDSIPEWVRPAKSVTVRAMGIGDVSGVMQLNVAHDAWADLPESERHPALHPAGGAVRDGS